MIRSAVPTDAPILADILILNWQTAFRGIVDQSVLDSLDQDQLTTRFEGQIRSHDPFILVATSDNRPVGYVVWTENPRDPAWPHQNSITQLFVHPSHHGNHLGTNLLKAIAKEATNRGHQGMMIGAFPKNTRAIALYQRLGAVLYALTTVQIQGIDYPEQLLAFSDLASLALAQTFPSSTQ